MARASEKGEGRVRAARKFTFWILNFLVLGVWLGALGQGRGGGWSGKIIFQFQISAVWLGTDSVSAGWPPAAA